MACESPRGRSKRVWDGPQGPQMGETEFVSLASLESAPTTTARTARPNFEMSTRSAPAICGWRSNAGQASSDLGTPRHILWSSGREPPPEQRETQCL